MSQREDSGFKTFEADAAITIYDRVKFESDGKITTAGLAERDIGTAQQAAFAAGDKITVKLNTAAGTHKVRVSEAVAAGAILYTESTGEVQDTDQATAFVWGVALEAATAADDVIEAMYGIQPDIAST